MTAQIPIIDFSNFRTGSDSERHAIAKDMRAASEDIGFFMLKNVAIPATEIEQAFKAAKNFFALPVEQKQKIAWQSAESNRGYIGVKRETLDPSQKPDLKEAFNLGTALTEADETDPAKNKWPAELPEFRAIIEPFISQCTEVSWDIFAALELALEAPAGTLARAHDKQQNTFRLLHYPALKQHEGADLSEKRAGAHTDYGSITLLFQDQVGGLEVLAKNGQWLAATPQENCIVVNIGDLMQRWTNDILSSNPHRVTQPDVAKAKDRYSIAYFCTPNKEQVIETLASCMSEKQPNKYQPISTQAHMLERLNRTY